MELRQLEYFLEVCNVRNFTKASEILHVAQPSVTKAIRRLEDELGTDLFDRTQKPIGLTEAGEYFYAQISAIMEKLRFTVHEVERIAKDKKEILRVGIPPMIGTQLLPFLISDFPGKPPGAVLNLVEMSCQNICEALMREELDLGWIMEWGRFEELEFLPVEYQEWFCVLRSDDPLAQKECLTFQDLREENFILNMLGTSTTTVNMIRERCLEAGYLPSCQLGNLQYTPHPTLLINWVRQGLGITFLPQYVTKTVPDLAMHSIDPPVACWIGLAWRADRKLTLIQKQVIAAIQSDYHMFASGAQKCKGNSMR